MNSFAVSTTPPKLPRFVKSVYFCHHRRRRLPLCDLLRKSPFCNGGNSLIRLRAIAMILGSPI